MSGSDLPHSEGDLRCLLGGLGEMEVRQQADAIAEKFDLKRADVMALWKQEQKAVAAEPSRKLAGRPISELLRAAEPWPEEVDGEQWLEECLTEIRRYVAMPEGAHVSVAVWNLYTHVWEKYGYAPYLVATSPAPECGKSTVLRLCKLLSSLPYSTGSMTTATLFRVVDEHHPILLLDEQDGRLERNEEMRLLLNEGFQRGSWVTRCAGDDAEPRGFDCFGPKALASIGKLPSTILSRSIVIQMERSHASLSRLQPDGKPEALHRLRRQAVRWAADHVEDLGKVPEVPGLDGRLADKWGPLLAVAAAAGGTWIQRVAEAAMALHFDYTEEEDHLTLLGDVERVLDSLGWPHFVSTERLLEGLNALPEAGWSEAGPRGDGLSAVGLAKLMKRFQLRPRDQALETGGARRRGYETARIRKACENYVSASVFEGGPL